MKLTVIGSAPAVAVPNTPQSGYLIEDGENSILFDCGAGVAAELVSRDKVLNLSAIVISHVHADHVADLISLGYTAKLVYGGKRIELWVHEQSLFALENMFLSLGDEKLLSTGFILKTFTDNFSVGKMEIECQEVPHDPRTPTFALKCYSKDKSIVYSADCYYNQKLVDFARQADVFICEATISKQDKDIAHMDFAQAVRSSQESQSLQTLLCHIHPLFYQAALEVVEQSKVNNVDIAYPGKVIEI